MMTNRITHLIDLNNWLKSLVLTNQSKFNKSTQKVEPANQRPCQLNFVYLCNLQSSPSLIGNQYNTNSHTNQNPVGSLNHAVSQLLYTFITNYLYQTIENYLFKITSFYFLKLHILKNLSQTYCVLMSANNKC